MRTLCSHVVQRGGLGGVAVNLVGHVARPEETEGVQAGRGGGDVVELGSVVDDLVTVLLGQGDRVRVVGAAARHGGVGNEEAETSTKEDVGLPRSLLAKAGRLASYTPRGVKPISCRAISDSMSRSTTCEENEAGVAWVMRLVATSPVL